MVECLSGDVIEVVLRVESLALVVVFTQVFHSGRFGVRIILTGHVIGHKVHDETQSGLVCAAHEGFKFSHAVFGTYSQVGVDVVIVFDGIGRTGTAFDDVGIVAAYAIGRIVRLGGVFKQARVPNMGEAVVVDA